AVLVARGGPVTLASPFSTVTLVRGVAVGQDRDHRDEQPRSGQGGQRRLLAALPGLVGGQGLGHLRVGVAVVVAELLPAWVQMPGHPTEPMPRPLRHGTGWPVTTRLRLRRMVSFDHGE